MGLVQPGRTIALEASGQEFKSLIPYKGKYTMVAIKYLCFPIAIPTLYLVLLLLDNHFYREHIKDVLFIKRKKREIKLRGDNYPFNEPK